MKWVKIKCTEPCSVAVIREEMKQNYTKSLMRIVFLQLFEKNTRQPITLLRFTRSRNIFLSLVYLCGLECHDVSDSYCKCQGEKAKKFGKQNSPAYICMIQTRGGKKVI